MLFEKPGIVQPRKNGPVSARAGENQLSCKRGRSGKKRDIRYIPLSNKQTNKILNILIITFAIKFIHRHIFSCFF
ncbi:MAG: hypothetical protein JWQ14_2652 [Adhaeribacter sp.]|nr:hypothetical protein [Adhaeribacter sp.]